MVRMFRHEPRFSRCAAPDGVFWGFVARMFRHENRFSERRRLDGGAVRFMARIFRQEARRLGKARGLCKHRAALSKFLTVS